MKKILILFLISGSVLTASAQTSEPAPTTTKTTTTTTTSHQYYYYPSSNVYYDKTSGNYWYKGSPSDTTWTQNTALPSTITIEQEKSYPVTYNGTDPWKNNASDLKKYKVKKNGTTKIKLKKDAQQ